MSGISQRTLLVAGVGLAAVIAMALLIAAGVGGERGALVVSDVGELLVVAMAAVVVLGTAVSLGVSEPLGRQWLLIGLGVACFALGDAVWTWIEVVNGTEVPYPGLPDVFYVAQYAFIAAGLTMAALAYKALMPVRRPFVLASIIGVVLLAVVGFVLFPMLVGPDVPVAESVLSIAYPTADILLMITPALFLLFVVAQMGGGRLARPWWGVCAGAFLVAAADSLYSWLAAFDRYSSGSVIDYGWSLGYLAIAIGASLAADLRIAPRVKAARAAAE